MKSWVLEARIANIADEIAYNNHDIDDGLRADLLDIESLQNCEIVDIHYDNVKKKWQDLDDSHLRHEIIRRMINYAVSDLIETSVTLIDDVKPNDIDEVIKCGKSLIKMSEKTESMHKTLKKFLRDNLYRHEHVNRYGEKREKTVEYLFNASMSKPELLTEKMQKELKSSIDDNDGLKFARLIADYVVGMTDRFAFSEYERISENNT